MKVFLTFCALVLQFVSVAQFAPQAGIAGSTAIEAGSSLFVGWASTCTVQRGYIDIANTMAGNVTAGDEANAVGVADGSIVSLGDSGIAVITFPAALYNGTGADFAIFENGFKDPSNGNMAFLELAFVEVSSDGINFTRFPATSNTPANTQIPGSGVYMDASLINNLAGKYVGTYGTPFDLEELSGAAGLDINNITHIRIVDVVGAVSGHSGTDMEGKVINDPYPTNFPTGGFDLEAVGAIHMVSSGIATNTSMIRASVFPNPASDRVTVSVGNVAASQMSLTMTSVTGKQLLSMPIDAGNTILNTGAYPQGIYYLTISDHNENRWVGKFVKY